MNSFENNQNTKQINSDNHLLICCSDEELGHMPLVMVLQMAAKTNDHL